MAHVAEAVQVMSRQRVVSQLSEVLCSQVLSSITRHRVLAWKTDLCYNTRIQQI